MAALSQLAERRVGDVTIIALSGRCEDGDVTVREWIDALARDGRVKVILDLHAVQYLDSTGLGTLAAKYLTLRRQGGDLKLLSVPRQSLQLLTVTKLITVFERFDNEDEAVASFGGKVNVP
jgi:anti-sigma B factor antagonist